MRRATIPILVVVGLWLLTGAAWAMSSDHYRMDWFAPLTGTGATVGSTHYHASVTVGQSVAGVFTGSNYDACLGYWCGEFACRVYLPLVLRSG